MQYTARSGSLALTATVARTVLRVASTSAIGFQVIEIGVFFDGIVATNLPVLVEIFTDDGVSGGTSSAVTPRQVRGVTAAATVTALSYSAEPTFTNLLVIKDPLVPPTSGLVLQAPLGRELSGEPGSTRTGVGIRITANPGVNVRAYMEVAQGPS